MALVGSRLEDIRHREMPMLVSSGISTVIAIYHQRCI